MPINRANGRCDRFSDLANRPLLFTASKSIQNGSKSVGGWKIAAEVRAIRCSFSSRAARVQKQIVSKLLESFIETSPRSRIHERACGEKASERWRRNTRQRVTGGVEMRQKEKKGWKIRRRDATTKEGMNYERIVMYREGRIAFRSSFSRVCLSTFFKFFFSIVFESMWDRKSVV